MKRSEALKKIRELMINRPIANDFENQVLDVVEKIGMLPPKYLKENEHNKFQYVCDWEPEE